MKFRLSQYYSPTVSKLSLAVLLLLIFSYISYKLAILLSQPGHMFIFMSPDFDTYAYLSKNLIYDHGSLSQWQLGAAPYLFPDIAFLYLTTLFIKNPYPNLLFFLIAQVATFIVVIILSFKYLTQSTSVGYRLGILAALLFLLRTVIKQPFMMYSQYDYFSAMFVPGFHFAAALIYFIAALLFTAILMRPKIYLKILLASLLILTGFSDPLFYIHFIFPAMICVIILGYFHYIAKKETLRLLGLLSFTFVAAYSIYHLLPVHIATLENKSLFDLSGLYSFMSSIRIFFSTNHLGIFIWLCFTLLTPYSLWYSHKRRLTTYRRIDYFILLLFISIIVSIPMLILTVGKVGTSQIAAHSHFRLSTLIHDIETIPPLPFRYMIPLILGPIFFGFPLLAYKHMKLIQQLDKSWIFIVLLIPIFIIARHTKPHHFYKAELFHYQPKIARCINEHEKIWQLHHGISNNYVVTNVVNTYSNTNIHIALVSDRNLKKTPWQTTKQVYQYHDYNFAVVTTNKIANILMQRYGKPDRIVTCSDKYADNHDIHILLYQHEQLDHIFS